MLELIRNNVQSTGVKFIVIMIILVMVFFGVNAFRNQGITSIATIDGYEVKAEKYQRAYDQTQSELRQRYQGQAAEYMKMMNIPAQIVQRLVNTVILMKSATQNGLAVTDLELARTIYENPAFQTDGRFDEKKYNQMLANVRNDKLSYEKDLKENLLTEKYLQFLSSDMLVNQQTVASEVKKYTTEMEIKVIDISPSMFLDSIEVTEEEVANYYDNHHPDFQQKKQFVVKYFTLGLDDVIEGLVVRDREITRYYERNQTSEFTTKESFKSRHILISASADRTDEEKRLAKEKIDDIYGKLTREESSFENLAQTYSNDPGSAKQGGDLGWVEQGTFVPGFETAVSGLDINEISRPFQTQYGYHIVQLLERKAAETLALEDVREQIETTIRDRKARRRLENKVAKLVKDVMDRSLDDIAAEVDMTVKTSIAFDDSKTVEDIGYSYDLYQEIRAKKLNETGYLELTDGKTILAYQVTEIIEPYVKPLEDVYEDAEYFARSQKAEDTMRDKLAKLKMETLGETEFLAISKEYSVNPKSGSVSIYDRNNALSLPEKALSAIYKLNEGEVTTIIDSKQGYLVWLIGKSLLSDLPAETEMVQNVQNAMVSQKTNMVVSGVINEMKSNVEIKLNQPMLDALNIQLN